MIRTRLKDYLIHPWFISLLIWIIILAFIPPIFNRYTIKYKGTKYVYGKTTYFYDDLDNDGNSEQISVDLTDIKQTKIIFKHETRVLDEYDLPGHPLGDNYLSTGDYDYDRLKECYIFTYKGDSIYLNIIDPIMSRKILVEQRFIDSWKSVDYSADRPSCRAIGLLYGKGGKTKDFFFYINAGFIMQPRKIYRYIIDSDSLIRSPENGTAIVTSTFADINNDSLPEILLSVAATGNHDEDFPYSDRHTWLMVLDHNLRFLFPPVKIGRNPSDLLVLPLYGRSRTSILAFYDYFGSDSIPSFFSLFDIKGNKKYEKPVFSYEGFFSRIFVNPDKGEGTFYFLKNNKTEILEYDSTFNIVNRGKIPPLKRGEPVTQIDADLDGKMEYIFEGIDSRSFIIVRDNFKYPAEWNSGEYLDTPCINIFLKAGEKPLLYLQFKNHGFFLKYEKNPLYYLKYPFFGVLYVILFLFITLLSQIQMYRLRINQKTEQEMTSLQMKAIKNQIDPHFTFNVLNAIGSLYANETDRNRADYIFGKYAKMIRQTVVTSDQIIVTLAEELDFIRNYLDIERFRCDDSFDYSVIVDDDEYMDIRIPRMLILTFVENAVKYGIRSRNNMGNIKIDISRSKKNLTVVVENSGPGPETLTNNAQATGRGLVILNELIELYFRLEKVKIRYRLGNMYGGNNIITGTSAVITIPV